MSIEQELRQVKSQLKAALEKKLADIENALNSESKEK